MNKIFFLAAAMTISLLSTAQKNTPAPTAPAEAPATPAPAPKVAKVTNSSGIPGNPIEIGLSGGLHAIWGDVSSNINKNVFNNSTFGIHIRKALTHSFSMRLQYNYGTATMRHNMPHFTAITNLLTNDPSKTVWFPATQTYSHTLSWDNIVTIGNNSMYKPNTKWTVDFFAGPSAVFSRTRADYRNSAGQIHNFAAAKAAYDAFSPSFINPLGDETKAKNEAGKVMDGLLDGTYETVLPNNRAGINVGDYRLNPGISFGGSINRALGEKFSLSLDQRFIYMLDDYIDGERFANFTSTPQYSQMNDIISNTTLRLGYFLGKKGAKPLYWRNQQEEINKKLASINPKKALNEALMDDDGDGVPNILDQEPGSREGCPVDTKGIMLDSDKDGLIDCDDKEPYSPAGYPVDNNGVAKVPPPACCSEIKAAPVVKDVPKNDNSGACADASLPTVKFDKNKFGVNSNMIAALKAVGDKMQSCPDMKLVVNGLNDKNSTNGKFNEQLSYNRAMEVTNYLSEKFGISRDRFIVRYNLEGAGDMEADRAVMFRSAQDGESGASNPPSPHPGLRAGTK